MKNVAFWVLVAALLVSSVRTSHAGNASAAVDPNCAELARRLVSHEVVACLAGGGFTGALGVPASKVLEILAPRTVGDTVVFVTYVGVDARRGRPHWVSFAAPPFAEVEHAVNTGSLTIGARPCVRVIEVDPAADWLPAGLTPSRNDISVPLVLLVRGGCPQFPADPANLPSPERRGEIITRFQKPPPPELWPSFASVVPTGPSDAGDIGLVRVTCKVEDHAPDRQQTIASCADVAPFARFLASSIRPDVPWTSFVDVQPASLMDMLDVEFVLLGSDD